MEKSEKTREKIIDQTIALIKENNGDTNKVTIRKIAENSEISVGLINHYFESKEHLIETCVQSIISGVIRSFRPGINDSCDPIEQLKYVSKQVMDFLMENQQISRISILGDLSDPKAQDNTMGTVMGFARRLSGNNPTQNDIVNTFMFTAILQESFLRKDVLKVTLGIDFYDKSQRDSYIDCMITKLIGSGGC